MPVSLHFPTDKKIPTKLVGSTQGEAMSNHSILNETLANQPLVFKWEARSGLIVTGCLLMVCLSIKTYQVIIDYIDLKPVGTSVDTLNIALFRNLQLQAALNMPLTILLYCTEGTGEGLAMTVAWALTNLSDLFILMLVAVTILHQVLILYPHLIEKDFTQIFQLVGCISVTLFIILDICLWKMGHLPVLYYELRKVPGYELDQSNLTVILRFVLMSLSLPTMFILRLKVYLAHRGRNQQDSKVISDKSLIIILLIMVCIGVAVRVKLVDRLIGKEIAAYSILNVWPICLMIFSSKLREFVLRKYELEQQLKDIQNNTFLLALLKIPCLCQKNNNSVDVERH